VPVTERSDAVKCRNDKQTGGLPLALCASLHLQLTLWLGLALKWAVRLAEVDRNGGIDRVPCCDG